MRLQGLSFLGLCIGTFIGASSRPGSSPGPGQRSRPSVSALASRLSADYIGAERCKLCHRPVYESWIRTPHGTGAALPESAEPRCASCHVTRSDGPRRVECESCHGPGGDYWPAEVMIDPEKASLAGLVRPDEAVCRRCHDNDEPGHADFVMPAPSDIRRTIHLFGEP